MAIADTSEKLTLNELSNVRNKRAPGYEITRKAPPPTAKRYRLTSQAYIHGRLYEVGEIVAIADEPAPYMIPVDAPATDQAEKKAEGRPKASKDVI